MNTIPHGLLPDMEVPVVNIIKMDLAIQVQILGKAGCISHCAWKGMNLTTIFPAKGN